MITTARTTLISILLVLIAALGFAQKANEGEVQIYVFGEGGQPLEGVTVTVDGETYESDDSGLLNFTHAPGKHEFALKREGRTIATVTVPVRQNQATEVMVTAQPGSEERQTETSGQQQESAEDIKEQQREAIAEDAPKGTLTGIVEHIESGEPVAGATVIFRGVQAETTTNESGEFSIELPEGQYSFSVIHPDFSTQQQDGVEVSVDDTTEVAIDLTPSAVELEEAPVFATEEVRVEGGIAKLIQETKNSGVVMNLIGQEQLGRTGDSDAAEAMRRVTGVTVVGGRFVYVRGMGERYSVSYLNGARLPSPVIGRTVVPLDLFPASVIESIAVQKTYSPNLLGEFGGGAIEIRSIGIPDDRYKRRLRTRVNTSIGYQAGVSFEEHLSVVPGRFDWAGFDDGSRKLPDEVPEDKYVQRRQSSIGFDKLPEEEVAEIGKSMTGRWVPEERTIPPNYSGSVSVRDKIELGESRSFGYNGAISFGSSWNHFDDRQKNKYEKSGLAVSYDVTSTTQNVDASMLLDLAYQHNQDFELEATSLAIRATDAEAQSYEGKHSDNSLDIWVREQEWVEQTLLNQSLRGTLGLGILNQADFTWQYAFSYAKRYEPDHRYVQYQDDDQNLNDFNYDNARLFQRGPQAAQRWWSSVDDFIHDGQVELEIPIHWFNDQTADYLDVGLHAMSQSRDTRTRRFYFDAQDAPPGLLKGSPDELFAEDNIGFDDSAGEFIDFSEATLTSDNYEGGQTILGGYFSGDILLFGDLRMNAGARFEYANQYLTTKKLFNGQDGAPVTTELESPGLFGTDVPLEFLPAINFTLPLTQKTQLRFGGSKTVNRPKLREISPVPSYGPPGFGVLQGNPDLKRAAIYSADTRFEAYIAEHESMSVGAFYKYFVDPIEVKPLEGANFPRTFTNIPSAYNLGVELEWQLRGRYISDMLRNYMVGMNFESLEREQRWRRGLGTISSFFRDLRTSGNVSLIRSQVSFEGKPEAQGDLSSDKRPLFGQSPWVVNATLGYKNSVSWSLKRQAFTSVFFSYHVFGPRIVELGTDTVEDTYEQPYHQLDLTFEHQYSLAFKFGISVNNLLDPWIKVRETLGTEPSLLNTDPNLTAKGDTVVQEYKKGMSVSISVTLDY